MEPSHSFAVLGSVLSIACLAAPGFGINGTIEVGGVRPGANGKLVSATGPRILTVNNDQINWETASLVSGNRWRIHLANSDKVAPYSPGELIGLRRARCAAWAANGTFLATR